MLYERCVEHAWGDQNSVKNHLDQCVEVQYLLNIASLCPALFSNDNNIGNAGNKNLRINLVIDNTDIIDHYKTFNILEKYYFGHTTFYKPVLDLLVFYFKGCFRF